MAEPEKEVPYGTGFRIAWCPWCVHEGNGQAPAVAVAPWSDYVKCEKHGASLLAPPLGPREENDR